MNKLNIEMENEHEFGHDAIVTIRRLPVDALSSLQRNIQHFVDMSALGLRLLENTSDVDLTIPDSFLTIRLSTNEEKPIDNVRQELSIWILRSGLRECIEMVSGFLEDIRQQSSIAQILKEKRTTFGEFQKAYEVETKQFHKLGFPKKIRGDGKSIFERYGITTSSAIIDSVVSINAARNCLVHRAGRVKAEDITENNQLTVKWYGLNLFAQSSSGKRLIEFPDARFEENETLVLEIKLCRVKSFSLNEPVIFTSKEFSEICLTLYLFGRETTLSTEKYFQSFGLLQNLSKTALNPEYEPKINLEAEFD